MGKVKNEIFENTEKVLSEIKTESEKVNIRNLKKLDANQSLKLSCDGFNSSYIGNAHIKSISINNESNTLSLNLYNGFILSVMSDIYKADFPYIKGRLDNVAYMMVFNALISKELRENPKPFLTALSE
jgi:hypothetical protein